MGSSSSKVARASATRKFPTRSPETSIPKSLPKSRHRAPQASPDQGEVAHSAKGEVMQDTDTGSEAISGDFSRRLQQMGVVQPNPTYSPSSTARTSRPQEDQPWTATPEPRYPPSRDNVTLSVLEARRQIEQRAEQDFESMGRASSSGRQFIDMRTLVDAMRLLERGRTREEVERQLKLQPQLLNKLGPVGIFTHVSPDKAQVDRW